MIETLQQFWTWAYLIGGGSFALVAILVMPLGLRDLLRLMRELADEDR
jgi:hypothetical protein